MTLLSRPELPCKLCAHPQATATYRLHQTTLYCCPHCDLHFIDYLDQAQAKQETEHSLSMTARQYIDRRQNEGNVLNSARLALLTTCIPLKNSKLLDIGAGTGQFLRLATAEAGCKAYGIEPSSLRRQYALEKYGEKLFAKYVDEKFWQTNYPDYFDVITLWDVLEHVNDPMTTLKGAAGLLKEGGILAIDTPNREVLSYRISEVCYRISRGRCSLFLDNFYAAIPYGHKQIFTTRQLLDLAASLDLEVVYCQHSYTSALLDNKKIILILQKPPRL